MAHRHGSEPWHIGAKMLSQQVLGKGSVLLLSLLGVGAASVLTVKQAPNAVFAV